MNDLTVFHDPAELPRASSCDHPSEHMLEAWCPQCGHEVDAQCPHCKSNVEPSGSELSGSSLTVSEFHRRLLLYLASKKNSKFAIYCFLIATGSGEADGLSMTIFARRFGVCKATVSKYCREIVETFNLPPSRYMLTDDNAAKFKFTNRRPVKNGYHSTRTLSSGQNSLRVST